MERIRSQDPQQQFRVGRATRPICELFQRHILFRWLVSKYPALSTLRRSRSRVKVQNLLPATQRANAGRMLVLQPVLHARARFGTVVLSL